MEVEAAPPGSCTPCASGLFGSAANSAPGQGLLGNLPFGMPPPPAGLGGGPTSSFGLWNVHGFAGQCRHGACHCSCECVCACECIVRRLSCCNCVPVEERPQPQPLSFEGFTLSAPSSASASASAALAPGPGATPTGFSTTGFGLTPPAAQAPTGFQGIFGGLLPGSSTPVENKEGQSIFGTSEPRKRLGDDAVGPFVFGNPAPQPFGAPARKKVIRQTMDIRGNYRPVSVDAAEMMAD